MYANCDNFSIDFKFMDVYVRTNSADPDCLCSLIRVFTVCDHFAI